MDRSPWGCKESDMTERLSLLEKTKYAPLTSHRDPLLPVSCLKLPHAPSFHQDTLGAMPFSTKKPPSTPLPILESLPECKWWWLTVLPPKLWIESLCLSSPGLLRGCTGKESACRCRRCGFDPWVDKIPWKRKWQLSPAFLPGKFRGPRSLAGYSPWGCKDLDSTEWLSKHTHLSSIASFLFISTLAYFSFYTNEFFPLKRNYFTL